MSTLSYNYNSAQKYDISGDEGGVARLAKCVESEWISPFRVGGYQLFFALWGIIDHFLHAYLPQRDHRTFHHRREQYQTVQRGSQ